MSVSLLTLVSRATGGALYRATAACRHNCSKSHHHPQLIRSYLTCAETRRMGVAGSCRRGNTEQDSDNGGTPASGHSAFHVTNCVALIYNCTYYILQLFMLYYNLRNFHFMVIFFYYPCCNVTVSLLSSKRDSHGMN